MTKKIRMLQTTKRSPDGLQVLVYEKDKDYTVPFSLANAFVNQMNVAMEVVNSPIEEKSIASAPSNKSVSKVELKPKPKSSKKLKVKINKYRKD